MPHYIAIVEEEGPDTAIGIWFPDLPGCFSAGDDLDDALRNAEEALAFWAESEQEEGRPIPAPRSLTELRKDPQAAEDLHQYMVAVIPLRRHVAHAAE